MEEDITVRFIAADLLSSKRAIGFVQFVDKAKIPAIKKGLHYFRKNTITEKDFAKKIKSNHFIYIKYKLYFSKYYFWHFYLIFDKKFFIFGPENSPRLHW